MLCSSYECGSMNWGGATIGWADTDSLYQRHSLSGSDSATVGCQYSSTYSAVVYSKHVREYRRK